MYLVPLAISSLFWIPADSTKWSGTGYGTPLEGRIILWMLQCCGPLAFILFDYHIFSPFDVTLIFSSIWGIWLVLACATRFAICRMCCISFLLVHGVSQGACGLVSS